MFAHHVRVLAAAAALLVAAPAWSDTIELLSAPPGLPEGTPVTQPLIVEINGVKIEPEPAIVTNTAAWSGASLDGGVASYISSCPTCGSDVNRCAMSPAAPDATPASIKFVHMFVLPGNATNPSLTITSTEDDWAKVYLNGHLLGEVHTCCGPLPGQTSNQLTVSDPTLFKPGANRITYELFNQNAPCPLSAAYRAVITFTR
jgi:hypothetical protein